MTNDDTTKAAVLHMLKRGLASYVEIAQLSGRSRQIIAHWGKEFPNARVDYLKSQWERAVKKAGNSRKK